MVGGERFSVARYSACCLCAMLFLLCCCLNCTERKKERGEFEASISRARIHVNQASLSLSCSLVSSRRRRHCALRRDRPSRAESSRAASSRELISRPMISRGFPLCARVCRRFAPAARSFARSRRQAACERASSGLVALSGPPLVSAKDAHEKKNPSRPSEGQTADNHQ